MRVVPHETISQNHLDSTSQHKMTQIGMLELNLVHVVDLKSASCSQSDRKDI